MSKNSSLEAALAEDLGKIEAGVDEDDDEELCRTVTCSTFTPARLTSAAGYQAKLGELVQAPLLKSQEAFLLPWKGKDQGDWLARGMGWNDFEAPQNWHPDRVRIQNAICEHVCRKAERQAATIAQARGVCTHFPYCTTGCADWRCPCSVKLGEERPICVLMRGNTGVGKSHSIRAGEALPERLRALNFHGEDAINPDEVRLAVAALCCCPSTTAEMMSFHAGCQIRWMLRESDQKNFGTKPMASQLVNESDVLTARPNPNPELEP